MELKRYPLSIFLDSDIYVLIVPFMELKHGKIHRCRRRSAGLNRTFYGIETLQASL